MVGPIQRTALVPFGPRLALSLVVSQEPRFENAFFLVLGTVRSMRSDARERGPGFETVAANAFT